MKIKHFYLLLIFLTAFTSWRVSAQTQVTVTGTTTPASGTQFSSLSAAFSAIGTSQAGKDIVITLSGSTTEPVYGAVLGAGTWNSLKIYPTVSGVIVTNELISASPLIKLNGADNVTIDGRVNQTGVADMIIDRVSTSGIGSLSIGGTNGGYTSAPTVTIGAPTGTAPLITGTATATISGGKVTGFTITNSGSGYMISPAPLVTLTGGGTATPATATAAIAINYTIDFENNAEGNTIQYCILKGNAIAAKGIVYFGSGVTGNTYGNGNNTIQNNLITGNSGGRPLYCIYSSGAGAFPNVGNKILNNEFKDFLYQKANTSTNAPVGVYIAGGATTPNNAWTITGNSFYDTGLVPAGVVTFTVIQIGTSGNPAGTGYTISDNYIGGSAKECGGATWTKSNEFDNPFTGIYLALTAGVPASSVQNNTIKNISWSNSANGIWKGIEVIAGDINIGTIKGNTIGDNTSTGSINYTAGITGANVNGIYLNNSIGIVDCQNNKIGSITANNSLAGGTGTTAIVGIYKSAQLGTITISKNILGSTSVANSFNSINAAAYQAVTGIQCSGTGTNVINGNIIANLANATTTSNANSNQGVIGIKIAGGTNTVNGNFIYGFSTPNSTGAYLYGIYISAGTGTYSNNIINLGSNYPNTIFGIYDTGLTGTTSNIYFNTVHICGSPSSGTDKSYCLYSAASANTRDFRNNIFSNIRPLSGAATGKHFATYLAYTDNTGLTMNYNDYFVTNAIYGRIGYHTTGTYNAVNDKSTLSAWQTSTGQDANSNVIDPVFVNAGGTVALNYLSGYSVSLNGTAGTGITTDFANVTRDVSTPRIGAFESAADNDIVVASGDALIIDQNKTVANLTINPGAKLTLNSGKTLNATTININSNVTNGTGTFVDNGTSNFKTVNVQQSLTGAGATTPNGRFWYVSSPVTGATSSVFDALGTNKLWYYTESAHGYTEITDNTTSLILGKGYTARLGADATVTFTGSGLYTGDKTISLTRNDGNEKSGYNLIGNPYPSFLDWQAVTLPASVMPTIWTRSSSSAGSMGFDTYNSATHEGVSSIGHTNVTQYIAPMQAFWVKVASGNSTGSITLTNEMRHLEDQTTVTNRLKVPTKANTVQQVLRLQVSNGTDSDETLIAFNPYASNGFDSYDSPKMSNDNASIPEIYTLVNDEKVAINGMTNFTTGQPVPLIFKTGESNAFSIKATEAINFDTDTRIVLRDNLLEKEQDLKDGDAYNFTSDVATLTSRFSILFKSASATTGTDNAMNEKQDILIYKNVNNLIAVSCTDVNAHEGMIMVCNAMGQKLAHVPTAGSSTVINQCFKPGVYLVTVTVGGRNTTTKIIIN